MICPSCNKTYGVQVPEAGEGIMICPECQAETAEAARRHEAENAKIEAELKVKKHKRDLSTVLAVKIEELEAAEERRAKAVQNLADLTTDFRKLCQPLANGVYLINCWRGVWQLTVAHPTTPTFLELPRPVVDVDIAPSPEEQPEAATPAPAINPSDVPF